MTFATGFIACGFPGPRLLNPLTRAGHFQRKLTVAMMISCTWLVRQQH